MDLPAGIVTGIGSLPHQDPRAAVAFVAETTPELPYWPQLPGRSPAEGMLAQTLGPLRGLDGEPLATAARDADPTLDPERAAGWVAFFDEFPEAFPRARGVKGQLAGPLTLAFGLLERAPNLADVDDRALLAVLAGWVARCGRWQAERLSALGLPTLVVVDEPCLGLDLDLAPGGSTFLTEELGRVGAEIRNGGASFGIHCCSPPPCALLREVGIDLLAFDAFQGLEAFAADAEAQALHRGGASILWGLAPTDPAEVGAATPKALRARWTAAAATHRWILDRCLFGPACGLAGLEASSAGQALNLLSGSGGD